MLSQNKQIISEWFQSKADTVNSVYLLNEDQFFCIYSLSEKYLTITILQKSVNIYLLGDLKATQLFKVLCVLNGITIFAFLKTF